VRLVNGAFGYESFRHLTAALRGEWTFSDKGFYEGMIYSAGLGGETFSAAQHSGSLGPARLMAKRMSLAGRNRLLDIGGGSGAYTLAFCAANPQLKATILDFPQTVETAKKYTLDAGLADRVAHQGRRGMLDIGSPQARETKQASRQGRGRTIALERCSLLCAAGALVHLRHARPIATVPAFDPNEASSAMTEGPAWSGTSSI
jgi:O-methyltransferase domain